MHKNTLQRLQYALTLYEIKLRIEIIGVYGAVSENHPRLKTTSVVSLTPERITETSMS